MNLKDKLIKEQSDKNLQSFTGREVKEKWLKSIDDLYAKIEEWFKDSNSNYVWKIADSNSKAIQNDLLKSNIEKIISEWF